MGASSEDRRSMRTITERLTTPHMPIQRSLPTLRPQTTQPHALNSKERPLTGQSFDEGLPLLTADVQHQSSTACALESSCTKPLKLNKTAHTGMSHCSSR